MRAFSVNRATLASALRTFFCFVAGVAFAGVSPPFDTVLLGWVGLGALAYALGPWSPAIDVAPTTRMRRMFAGGARGLGFGTGVNIVAVRFVPDVIARFTPLPWALGVVALVLLALAQGLVWWVAAIARAHLVRARVPAFLAFAMSVHIATFVPAVFPWTPAGAMAAAPKLMQLADTIGERGVSLLIALSAGALGEALRRLRSARSCIAYATFAIALPYAMTVYGTKRILRIEAIRAHATAVSVALLQPAIGATDRWEARNAPANKKVAANLRPVAAVFDPRDRTLPPLGARRPLANGEKNLAFIFTAETR